MDTLPYILASIDRTSGFIFLVFVVVPCLVCLVFLICEKIDHRRQVKRGYVIDSSGSHGGSSITYSEGGKTIVFAGEWQSKMIIFQVPNEELWRRRMPEWTQNRRTEILERIYEHYQKQIEKNFYKFETIDYSPDRPYSGLYSKALRDISSGEDAF